MMVGSRQAAPRRHQSPRQPAPPVYVLRSPAAVVDARRRRAQRSNWLLGLVGSTVLLSNALFIWHQTVALESIRRNSALPMERAPPPPPKPLRFISVVGTYHSGTTALWKSIKSNEGIATAKGIDLKAYGMSDASGYPPCEVPLLNDSSVDMDISMGNSSGIDEPNTHLFAQYGAMWGDWSEEGPYTIDGVLKMAPPHKRDVFYSWYVLYSSKRHSFA
ncbi:hypothetical protein ACHAWF_015261 [Thalassiosira exigua]